MENKEIIEMNKKEKEVDEKLEYVQGTIEQYKKQLSEYKETHKNEFEDKETPITDFHAIGSLNSLKIEREKESELQEEKDKFQKIRNEEKKKVENELEYVQGTIEQYKKQILEYKESHKEEFEDKNTPITDIHVIGSLKALKIEIEKEKELQEKLKLLNFDEELMREYEEKESTEQPEPELTEQPERTTEQPESESSAQPERTTEQPKSEPPVQPARTTEQPKSELPVQPARTTEQPKSELPVQPVRTTAQPRETSQIKTSNGPIKIVYDAKKDEYSIEMEYKGKTKIVNYTRERIEKIDSTKILEDEDVKRNIDNLDINVIKLLSIYDKNFKTDKTSEYIKVAEIGKSKEDRQDEMKNIDISIEYKLKGLYDTKEVESEYDEVEDFFSKEERENILKIANNAKKKGMATVKKGVYVAIREKIDNVLNKFKNIKLLSSASEEETRREERREKREEEDRLYEEEMQEMLGIVERAEKAKQEKEEQECNERKEEGYSQLVNRKYMETLDEEFDKALQENESKHQQFAKEIKAEPNTKDAKVEPTMDDVLNVFMDQGYKIVDKDGEEIER